MPLVTSTEILKKAQAGGYAVGAFNVENMEMAIAIISAAEELKSPVILQTTPSTVRYAGLDLYVANVTALAKKASVPVVMHLDHGSSFELAAQALRAGYTSIMIDGSKLPLDENIAVTKKVVDMCKAAGVPVEGELGQVGGKEDDTECENAGYTIPSEAIVFEKETSVTSLAVGVGTAHGFYAEEPVLNKELITQLKGMLDVPMVLHGASGVPEEDVKDCISRGICKVNYATELRVAYSTGVKAAIAENPSVFDPKVYGKAGIEKVKELVKNRIMICGCNGKM
ncbi:MAG: class II fructose-bisphosphate aldolase [Clostridia bacterium]